MFRRPLLMLALAALVVPASGLSVTDVDEAVDPSVRLALCTPEGTDYWVEYCFSWQHSTETVRYVESAEGEDPWCIVYPVPCGPSPADPVQYQTTDARLTRLVSEVEVDSGEVCGDLWCPNICPYLGRLCHVVDVYGGALYLDGPVALADVDWDTAYDGVAVRQGSTWTYAGFCDDHTLSVSCTQTLRLEAKRLTPTDLLTICTPDGDDYWVDHCSQYDPYHLHAHRTTATIRDAGDMCIIYPVPCVDRYQGEIVQSPVEGDVWLFRTAGETDRSEVVDDLCQLDCPTWQDVKEICDRIRLGDAALNCDLAVIAQMIVMPPWYIPQDLSWYGAVNAGLMDTDGNGLADGVAIAYLPAFAWVETGLVEIMWAMDISYAWEYVPFSCFEVDPVYLHVRDAGDCLTVAIDISDVSALS